MSSEIRVVTASGGAIVTVEFDDDDGGYTESVGGYGGHQLLVVGHGRIVAPKHEAFVVPEAVIAAADISSLHAAMLDDRRCCKIVPKHPEHIYIALEDDPHFHARSSPRDQVLLMVDADRVSAVIDIVRRREPPWSPAELAGLLAPAVEPHGCTAAVTYTVEGLDPDAQDDIAFLPGEREQWREDLRSEPHEIRVTVSARGDSTVAPLLAAGRDVAALLDAHERGTIDAVGARHLVRAGKAHLLAGLPENEWLEVKSGPYQLSAHGSASTKSKVELAQDVARFANGDCDAVLLIGFREKKEGQTSLLAHLSPVPLTDIEADQHRKVIDDRVVPPIDGLLVERIDMGNQHGLLMISVPPQPREMQPYLVHGSVVGDKVEGAFISIVRRRGEASITTSAKQIHAYIVAGRAFLRQNSPE
jgi:hypothetical protein